MTGSAILPVTIHKNKLLFLFGKENSLEDSAKGFSDFGGGVENEDIFSAALREGAEELTGFLGDEKALKLQMKNVFPIVLHGPKGDYHTHLFFLPYDENLPRYFNRNHAFLWNRMDKTLLQKTKLFEKIEIGWFSVADLTRRKTEFRFFYQDMVDLLLAQEKDIRAFLKKKRRTRKL